MDIRKMTEALAAREMDFTDSQLPDGELGECQKAYLENLQQAYARELLRQSARKKGFVGGMW